MSEEVKPLGPRPDVLIKTVPVGEKSPEELAQELQALLKAKNGLVQHIERKIDPRIHQIQQSLGKHYLPQNNQPLTPIKLQDERVEPHIHAYDPLICPCCDNLLLINKGGEYSCNVCQRRLTVYNKPWGYAWDELLQAVNPPAKPWDEPQ